MILTDAIYGKKKGIINLTPAINQMGLSFWLESQVQECFPQQTPGTSINGPYPVYMNDLITEGKTANISNASGTDTVFTNERAWGKPSNGTNFNIDGYYYLNANEDFTFGCFFKHKSPADSSTGLFSNGINTTDTGLGLISLRPRIKISNIFILDAATGPQLTQNDFTYVTLSIKSHIAGVQQGTYSVCYKGVEVYAGNHNRAMPSRDIRRLSDWYNPGNSTLGDYKSFHFYRRALTPTENLENYNALLTAYNGII